MAYIFQIVEITGTNRKLEEWLAQIRPGISEAKVVNGTDASRAVLTELRSEDVRMPAHRGSGPHGRSERMRAAENAAEPRRSGVTEHGRFGKRVGVRQPRNR